MKKHLCIIVGLFLLSLAGLSQANLVIFSENGDAFYAYVNGIKQNDTALSTIKITGLPQNVSLHVKLAGKTKPRLKQNMVLMQDYEFSVRIQNDSKKHFSLHTSGQAFIGSGPASNATTVAYRSIDDSTSFNSTSNITGLPGSILINMAAPDMSGVEATVNNMEAANSTGSSTASRDSLSISSYRGNNRSHHDHATHRAISKALTDIIMVFAGQL